MTYRVYLRTFDGQVSEKTITRDQDVAAEAFAALLNRTDLDGQKIAAALTYQNRQLAFHRFDRDHGDMDHWMNRLNEIPWPQAGPLVGRPAELSRGRNVNTYLDAESLEIASRLGAGNVSEGIRQALAKAK